MQPLNDQKLREAIPASIAAQVRSLRARDGRVSVVADASGLTEGERAETERAITRALEGVEGVKAVHVAMMAERAPQAGGAPASAVSDSETAAAPHTETAGSASPGPKIIAVGSGKGGVGKSTLAANLAIALSKLGAKVGLVDADIYGPSLPRIMGVEGTRPAVEGEKLVPVPSRWGPSLLSMGQLIEPGKAIAWRGPMTGRALGQMIDAAWGDTELLVVDLPPGTGDIQMTMLQRYPPAGAVIVSTPQDLALIDAARAMQLFEMGGVPILGLVENMAGYACPECGAVSDPFGHGGAETAAAERGIPFLGRIPLTMTIRRGGDEGEPVAAGSDPEAEAFVVTAQQVMDAVAAAA